MSWTIDCLTEWDSVMAPETLSRWERAFVGAGGAGTTPFMHPAIQAAYVEAAGRDTLAPCLCLARRSDGTEAVVLLARQRGARHGGPSRIYGFCGAGVFDYTEPVVLPGQAGAARLDDAFWRALRAAVIGRSPVRADYLSLPRLRVERFEGADLRRHSSVPILRLAGLAGAEAYLGSRSAKMRATLRRARRQIEAEGRLSFTVHAHDEAEAVLSWLPRFLAFREARLAAADYPVDPAALFPALVRRGLPAGLVHASSLDLDGEPISWEINFFLGGTLYGYSCAFDPAFRQFSPGSLHKLELIDWLCANGGSTFDFMRGGEGYKRRWTDGDVWTIGAFETRGTTLAARARLRAGRQISAVATRIGAMTRARPAVPARIAPRTARKSP